MTDRYFILAQYPNPYGGYGILILCVFLVIVLISYFVLIFFRRHYGQTRLEQTPQELSNWNTRWGTYFGGFLSGCILVAITVVSIDLASSQPPRGDWYEFCRVIHYLSLLGFIAGGIALGVLASKPFYRNGVSWGLLIGGMWALLTA